MRRPDGNLLSEALYHHWRQYRKRLKACRRNSNEDQVHELRTGTRRLLSLIELLQLLDPHPTLAGIRKPLKAQLDSFDDLRDTQVMLFEIAKILPILPELAPFLDHLHRCEQQLLLQVQPLVSSLHRPKLRRKIDKTARHFRAYRSTESNLTDDILTAIDSVYAEAARRYRKADAADLTSIHRLRIAVKKLRYLLQVMSEIIPDLPPDHDKRIQGYLTRMGDIQNSSVLLAALDHFFLAQIPKSPRQYYQQQQSELLHDFVAHREEILGFWRIGGDQPFPWQ